MRQFFYFLALLTIVSLASCSSNEEELWIEADGSGRFESTMDLSGIYPFLLMGLDSKSEEEEGDAFNKMIEGLLQSESVDTVINLSNLMAQELEGKGSSIKMLLDSLQSIDPDEAGITEAEKQANLKTLNALMSITLRMQIDKSASMFKITTINPFEDITDFKVGADFMELLVGMGDQSPAGGQSDIVQNIQKAQTQFSIDGKTLSVSRQGQDPGEMSEEDEQQMKMVEGMLGNEPYRLTIHFPGKVKKRLKSDYATRVDNQTVVIEIPQEDLKNPEMEMDLGIKFKGLK